VFKEVNEGGDNGRQHEAGTVVQ